MALVYRFVKIQDRANTHVFTFVVTKSVTRDLHRDVTSKEFTYGYQRWAITFSRTEKVLGVYLVWRNPSEGMRVYIDFTFTLLNREHFSVNESFSGKQVKFTFDSPAQGNRRYVAVADLYGRNFTDENGEFQLELTMSNIRTVYESDLRVVGPNATPAVTHGSVASATSKVHKFESTYFSFGGFDWNLAVYPHGRDSDPRLLVFLNRLTGFDRQCRIRYNVVLGEAERRSDSGILDDISDCEGKGHGWPPRARLLEIAPKGTLRVHLELILANALSEVFVSPFNHHLAGATHCYDRDKQAWCLEADTHGETLRLRMVYKDVHNVPRNHLRYVCWNSYLLRYHPKSGHMEPIPLLRGPYSHYYVQEEVDNGIIMESDVPIKELHEPGSTYLTDKSQLRVQIEWGESHLLFQATYHKYDEVCRVHGYQMRKEVNVLQAENYSLERQLFSYQKSIAYAHATTTEGASDEDPTADGYPEVPPEEEQHPHHYYDRAYSLGDRSASTDTEYA